jgi:hypothetical protein
MRIIEDQLRRFETQPVFAFVVAILDEAPYPVQENLMCNYKYVATSEYFVKPPGVPNNRD